MRIITLLIVTIFPMTLRAQVISTARFADAVAHWNKTHDPASYGHYTPEEFRAIADNLIAYQNDDGGWPKNLDPTARLNPDSVRRTIDAKHLRSTLDNANGYTQIEYLAEVYRLTQQTRYRDAAVRGMEYILATQYPTGGWRGWDADAATFNDGIIYGVLSLWLEILQDKAPYQWVEGDLRTRIEASWNHGLKLVLATQWKQNGTRTVWAQQYDHTTLQPVKARAYELPGLAAAESADIVMLLMRIRRPSPEVIEAVKAAAGWFERSKIEGKRLVTVNVPEGLPEDPKIKKDRYLIDDPQAAPLWARYYDLDNNRPFFSTRTGDKVYTLAEVPAERRTGYSWYGSWGEKVLKKYPSWLAKIEKQNNDL